jgi:hypothetical protein
MPTFSPYGSLQAREGVSFDNRPVATLAATLAARVAALHAVSGRNGRSSLPVDATPIRRADLLVHPRTFPASLSAALGIILGKARPLSP